MEGHPTLSRNIPRFAPPRTHVRKASRSPSRNHLGDDLLSDLSPTTTLEAFTSPSGKLKASIEAATPSERAFGIRATVASKRIQEWVAELSDWPWPAEGGSLGFQMPAAKRRKLSSSIPERRTVQSGLESTNDEDPEPEYIGSLLAQDVEKYEVRIDEITDEMDELDVEDIKRQVLDTHFSPKSRPSSSASSAPMPSMFASYTKMDDFTAVVTATVLQSLPNLSRLHRLMDVWTIRLMVLRKVPPLVGALEDAEIALQSGWNAIGNPRIDHSGQEILDRKTFEVMMDVLQAKVTALGKELDFMLDTLEGRQDTLPDLWLDRMETIERKYGEWVVAGDRKVRQGDWVLMEKKRRDEDQARRLKEEEESRRLAEESDARRLREVEITKRKAEEEESRRLKEEAEAKRLEEAETITRKAEEEALEVIRLQALKEAEIARLQAEHEAQERLRILEEAETARFESVREAEESESAGLKAEHDFQENAKIEALKAAAEAEAARLLAEEEARNIVLRKIEEDALENARLKALKESQDAEIARLRAEQESLVEAARIKVLRDPEGAENARRIKVQEHEHEAEIARLKAEQDSLLEVVRLKALKDAEDAEMLRLKVEEDARNALLLKAQEDAANSAQRMAEEDALKFSEEEARIAALKKAEKVAEDVVRHRALIETEQVMDARIQAEEEARQEARLRSEVEARRNQDQQDADAKAKRLRLQQEAHEKGQQEAENLFHEAQAAETLRLEAGNGAQEAIIRKAESDAEARQVENEFAIPEAARLQAGQDAVEAARLVGEQETRRVGDKNGLAATEKQTKEEEVSRLGAEQETEIARLQLQTDLAASPPQRLQQKAKETAIIQRQTEQDTESSRRSEIAHDECLKQLEHDQPEIAGHADSVAIKTVKDMEVMHEAGTSRAQVSGESDDSILQPTNESDGSANTSISKPTTAVDEGIISSHPMGTTASVVTIGAGVGIYAALPRSKRTTNPLTTSPIKDPILKCGCPITDGPSSIPPTPIDHNLPDVSKSMPWTASIGIDEVPIREFVIDMPIKLEANEALKPSLGSPIHFDDHASQQGPIPSTLTHLPPERETPQTPQNSRSRRLSSSSPPATSFKAIFNTFLDRHFVPPSDGRNQHGIEMPTATQAIPTMFDGANDVRDTLNHSDRNAWTVINSLGDEGDEEDDLHDSQGELDSKFESEIAQDVKEQSSITPPPAPPSPFKRLFRAALLPMKAAFMEEDDGAFIMPSPSPGHPANSTSPKMIDEMETPSKFTHMHEDIDELESSVLSPVVEETLMPSIEVDNVDGSCDACDAYHQDDDEVQLADLVPRSFLTSAQRRESISSETSTIVNSHTEQDSLSALLDSSMLESFDVDLQQSPSAGRVGHRVQMSHDISPLASPRKRLLKQRSLQVLKTPGYSPSELSTPSTPLDAPLFDGLDVTAAPLLGSPRKGNNDEQLQQQISSLLEKIPARIRLTSDQESKTSSAAQLLRTSRSRRSLTPNLRPSSTMSNYSTYSRAPTPSFTLAPAFSKTTQRSRGSVGHPEIKLYHLSRSTGEAPIKLFVRLVGENGERVMVRVGGGWADLGEYLKEYASHHGRRTGKKSDKVEVDMPSRTVSGSRSVSGASITSDVTVRGHGRSTPLGNGRSTPLGRPLTAMDNRPGSSLYVRKSRKSLGAASDSAFSSRVNDIRNESPATPLPPISRRTFDSPPSATSVASSSVSGGRSSRLSWTPDEESSLGLAGPKAKKMVMSEREQEWVDSMKEKVTLASAEKERRNKELERLNREKERKTSFGEMGQVGATKRLFRKGLVEKLAATQLLQKSLGGGSGGSG